MSSAPTKISGPARQVALAALAGIYDKQALAEFQKHLGTIKTPKAIAPVVALAATATLQQLGPKGAALPEPEMWGKGGVVQVVLGSLFELAKEMGYKAPHSDLKQAYQIVEQQIQKSGFGQGPQQQQQPQGGPPQQGGPQQGPPQGQPNLMGGAMPQGVQQ